MQPTPVNPLMQFLPFIFIFVIFYFLLIRPQKQSQKQHQEMIKNLQKNDEVVTSGGIHGKIVNIKDNTIVLRIDDNAKMEINRSAVAYLKKETKPQVA